jgi:hypothetical protein
MYANPFISISAMNAGQIKLGKSGNLLIICGNAGEDTIVKGTIRITLSCGANARFTSVSKIKKSAFKDWKVEKISSEATGNYIKLVNNRKIEPYDLSRLVINVKGVRVTDPEVSNVQGFVGYVLEFNDELGNHNASQGNMSSMDDNSTTSFTVKK